MKPNLILFVIITIFFSGCNSINSPTSSQIEPTIISTLNSTSKPILTATSTSVPIITDIICEPSSNPFAQNLGSNSIEYHALNFPNIPITKTCTFNGNISRGKIYKHQIANDLVFCLVPSGKSGNQDEGWYIVISDALPGSCDKNSNNYVNFGPVVTNPMRGNPLFDVYGWHFRNEDNTGENNGSLNVPQEERIINFVFNRKDYDAVLYSLRCNQWGIDEDCAIATKTSTNADIPRSSGKFTITKLELGNLVPDSYAWIEKMEFKFEVYLP